MLEDELMKCIDYWHIKCPYLGSRKILDKVRKEGYAIGRKKVRRLMYEMGFTAIYPKINLFKQNFKEAVVPYLLCNYKMNFPNQVWSSDITEVVNNS
ncbi:putative transposase [Selenomonas sp. WCT3]|nr:putative transposase [Selenomonas ruminantium]